MDERKRQKDLPLILWNFLGSRKVALILLLLLVVTCAIGALVPQAGGSRFDDWVAENPEALDFWAGFGLTGIFKSWWFYGLCIALFASLFTGTLSRADKLFSSWWKDRRRKSGTGLGLSFFLRRGTIRQLGSILFHLSLLGLLFGSVVALRSRAEGNVLLMEGQAKTILAESRDDAGMIPSIASFGFAAGGHPEELPRGSERWFQVRLDKFKPVHGSGMQVPNYASDLSLWAEGRSVESHTVDEHSAFSFEGVTFYQDKHGFAPTIEIRDQHGRELQNDPVAFNSTTEEPIVRYLCEFEVRATGTKVKAEFFPEMIVDEDVAGTKSINPDNPGLFLTVLSRAGEVVFEGPMYLDQPIELDGLTMTMTGVRYWSMLRMVRDCGKPIIFFFLWFGLASLIIRYAPEFLGGPKEQGKGASGG